MRSDLQPLSISNDVDQSPDRFLARKGRADFWQGRVLRNLDVALNATSNSALKLFDSLPRWTPTPKVVGSDPVGHTKRTKSEPVLSY